jgi:hypothetical protein
MALYIKEFMTHYNASIDAGGTIHDIYSRATDKSNRFSIVCKENFVNKAIAGNEDHPLFYQFGAVLLKKPNGDEIFSFYPAKSPELLTISKLKLFIALYSRIIESNCNIDGFTPKILSRIQLCWRHIEKYMGWLENDPFIMFTVAYS